MNSLTTGQIIDLRALVAGGVSFREAMPGSIGGAAIGDGLWRFFSDSHPQCGVDRWNDEWCVAWALPKESVFAFGEDVFGNQLLLTAGGSTVHVCDHENGSCHDLELGAMDLLEASLQHGISWVDFYSNGSLEIAKGFLAGITWEQHLHWVQPLILGGAVATQNVSIVERLTHLSGHAKLWKQISEMPPGTEIHIQ